MTSPSTVSEASITRNKPHTLPSWGSIAIRLAREMARVNSDQYSSRLSRGDLAALRRMDLDDPDPVVIRVMASEETLEGQIANDAVFRKWALILNGLSLMTPKSPGDSSMSAHDNETAVGLALYRAGYSESRVNRLLVAREAMLYTLLSRMFRMLAAAGQRFDWSEMARFIRNSDYREVDAERNRRRIAGYYYRAVRLSSSSENAEY